MSDSRSIAATDTTSSIFALANHYLDVGRPRDALRTLGDAGGAELKDPEYWRLQSQAQCQLGAWHEGARLAIRGLALAPDDTELHNLLGLCRSNAGEHAEAEATFERALELDPENCMLLSNLALTLVKMDRLVEARVKVDKAVELAPGSPFALRIRAIVAAASDSPETAAFVDKLLEADPEDAVGHQLRGVGALEGRRYADAMRAFDEAARLDPTRPSITANARNARVAMHPIHAPVRLIIWRFGWTKSYLAFIGVWLLLAAVGLNTLLVVVIGIWLGLGVLSQTAPGVLRWWAQRRHGGF